MIWTNYSISHLIRNRLSFYCRLKYHNKTNYLLQVVYVATYAYFLLALVGYQILSEEPEIFFPFFLVLKFVFFIGLLKVRKDFIFSKMLLFFIFCVGGFSNKSSLWRWWWGFQNSRTHFQTCVGKLNNHQKCFLIKFCPNYEVVKKCQKIIKMLELIRLFMESILVF